MAQQGTTGRPKYLLIADGLREKIGTGAYPVDSKLPAVRELATAHGTAQNTVRAAIGVLAQEGLVESFQGDGIYVRKLPEPGRPAPSYPALAQEIGALRDEVRELSGRVESLEPDSVKVILERVELNLIDLYAKLGFDYPREDAERDGYRASRVAAR